jgi:hypothetical protein
MMIVTISSGCVPNQDFPAAIVGWNSLQPSSQTGRVAGPDVDQRHAHSVVRLVDEGHTHQNGERSRAGDRRGTQSPPPRRT